MARLQRTQVSLDPALADSLDRLARQRGTSRAEILRVAARQLLAQEQPVEDDPIFGLIGIGRSGLSDVSARHDDYLVEDEISGWKR